MASNTSKRTRKDLSDTDSDNDTRPDNWPHFLLIKGTDEGNSIQTISPFAVQKGIKGIVGTDIENVKRLRSGDLLAEVSCEKHAKLLLKAKKIGTVPVSIVPHRSLNSSKGVVRCDALGDCEDAEIVKCLANSNVVEAKRIKVRRDGVLRNTNTVILTFCVPELPKEIRIGYNLCRVEQYIPNSLRCFRCQSYGHGKDRCRGEAVCARCGSNEHSDDKACSRPEFCIHCKSDHPSYSRKCPKFILEQEIVRVKFTQKITFPEARRLVEPKQPSYANIVSQPKRTVSTGTQTELTWQESSDSFKYHEGSTAKVNASTCTSMPSTSTTTQNPTIKATTTKVKSQKKTETTKSPLPNINPQKPTTAPKPNPLSNRPRKGSDDPIIIFNKYGELEDMDTDHPLENKTQRPRSPVIPPKK